MPRANTLGAPAPASTIELPPPPRRLSPKPQPVPPPRRWLWFAAALVIAAMVAAGVWLLNRSATGRARQAAIPFRTAKVKSSALTQTLRVTGVTSPLRYTTMMSPRLSGSRRSYGSRSFELTLESIVPGGAKVKQGEVVASFEQLYMRNRLDDYRASVQQHENNLKRLKALLQVTRVNHEQQILRARSRMEKAALDLKTIPIVSAIQAEKLRLTHQELVSQYKMLAGNMEHLMVSEGAAIRRSELDLQQSRLEMQRAERNAEKMTVKAPMDGIAVIMTTRRGHDRVQIGAGDQLGAGQPFMRIVDTSSMLVSAQVNQVDAQKVRLGLRANVQFDAYPDLELPAQVIGVGSFAQGGGWRGEWVRQVALTLKLDELDERVVPDLSVSADLKLKTAPVSPVVPRECVFTEPGETQPFVFVRKGGGWEKRPVETGLENHVEVAVLSGVREGEVLAAEWPGVQQAGL